MYLKAVCFTLILCITLCIYADAHGDVYRHADTERKLIALTFDDGPHYKYTEEILDILKKYGVKATFFMIGANAEKHPHLARRVFSEGHEIGNHTYSHPHLKGLSENDIQKEIEASSAVIEKITGSRPTLFRPPEGFCGKEVTAAAENMGYTVILWSQDTRDWAHNAPEKISSDIINNVRCGDIILFHDFITPSTPTPAALEKIIPHLCNDGYEFVTVSELIAQN